MANWRMRPVLWVHRRALAGRNDRLGTETTEHWVGTGDWGLRVPIRPMSGVPTRVLWVRGTRWARQQVPGRAREPAGRRRAWGMPRGALGLGRPRGPTSSHGLLVAASPGWARTITKCFRGGDGKLTVLCSGATN